MSQYQIIWTNTLIFFFLQTVRRIINEIMGVKGLRFFLSCKVMHKLSSTSYENSYSTNLSLLSIPCGMNICNSFILWIGDIWSCARTIYLQLKMMKNRLNFYNFFCLIFYHLKWGEPASLFLTQWLVIEPMPTLFPNIRISR